MLVLRRQDIGRGEIRDHFASLQEYHALREEQSFVEIMRHEEHGLADALEQVAEHRLHLRAGERIERAERLVHQQDAGIRGQSSSQPDALALSAGKLPWIARSELGEIEPGKR
jgi:hypothetical protein